MRIAVNVGVFNEEKTIGDLIKALLSQKRLPDEIVIVDDESNDNTAAIIKEFANNHRNINYIYQKNAGPAVARNKAWKNSNADICIFTDGDCIPEPDWIEKLLKPFTDQQVGATAGTYKTINRKSLLARFIGLEIDYKYRDVRGQIDAHGTYNLAVKKTVLESVGGLCEDYPMPSGEDWDMTYKISRKHKIIFVPEAIVGHYHPENFRWYMKNQTRRGFDRIKLYNDNPEKAGSDVYTGKIIKYQVWASGIFVPSILLFFPIFNFSYFVPLALGSFIIIASLPIFFYLLKRDLKIALISLPVILSRNYAWFWGMLKGIKEFGFMKILKGVLQTGM